MVFLDPRLAQSTDYAKLFAAVKGDVESFWSLPKRLVHDFAINYFL